MTFQADIKLIDPRAVTMTITFTIYRAVLPNITKVALAYIRLNACSIITTLSTYWCTDFPKNNHKKQLCTNYVDKNS